SPIIAPTMQACRECGAGAPLDAHVCPQCGKILPLGRRAPDYFAFLGLPRKLHVGADDLEQRFRMLSRQFHPDYFYNATPAGRRERARRPIEAKRAAHDAHVQALSARWDALVNAPATDGERRDVLNALRDRVLERNYIANLLAGIQRELEG